MPPSKPSTSKSPDHQGPVLRLADLPRRKPSPIVLRPDAGMLRQMAEALGIIDVQKARLEGTLTPVDDRDWDLTATIGATVTQACVATLEPVRTRIEDDVELRFRAELVHAEPDSDMEMPEDESVEPLPANLDLLKILLEAVSLALPLYPRVDGAELAETVFTEPGKTPLRDQDLRPFAGLADLKRKMDDSGET